MQGRNSYCIPSGRRGVAFGQLSCASSPSKVNKDDRSPDDRVLVEAALRDSGTYFRIVVRYEHVLRRYVRRLLGPYGQSSDDVLQETFIKVFLNLNDYDRVRPFAPWIYRIAHNEAVSFLRKRRAQPQAIGGEDGRQLLERISGSDLNENLAPTRSEEAMRTAMTALEPQYRVVLILRFLEERSYDDIADILEIPMGTVATRIRRGLQRLKTSLLASGETFGDLGSYE